MSTTRAILIIGGSGYIGTHLAMKLREGYKVFATCLQKQVRIPGVTFIPMEASNDEKKRNWIKRVVYTAHPETIIYAAGSNSLEAAEKDERTAENAHGNGAAAVLTAADILKPKFIYLSNAYVFDGQRGNYHETDTVVTSTALGRCKASGENAIKSRSLNYCIIRSSTAFGRGNGKRLSFLDTLRLKLDRKEKLQLDTSELHSYVPISGLVEFVTKVVEAGPRNKILHYGGLTRATPYEFGKQFARTFGYDPNLVIQYKNPMGGPGVESPPLDYSLNLTQAVGLLKVKPLLLEEGLDLLKKELVARF